MGRISRYFSILSIVGSLALLGAAQTKKTPHPLTKTPSTVVKTGPTPEAQKKNERPTDGAKTNVAQTNFTPTYFYEFTRPGFVVSHVVIEHDAAGKGKISFLKQDFRSMMTDPLLLTSATVMGINETLDRMNFLTSTEDYQYEKDLSNMGNIQIRFKKDGRDRLVKYNWTTNKDAKFLMDEYRRITNEAVWKFDMAVARENQPLQTPGMVDALDSYLKRNEITDPPHLVPFLKELTNDERLPLIARNRATRMIAQIEKSKK